MKADYLTLTDGRRVRVEFNMNALDMFVKVTGKEMSDLTDGKADVGTLRTIAWCSAKEGEIIEGRELGIDEIHFGRLMNMANIIEFSEILASQSDTGHQKKSPERGRIPRIFFRKG